MGKHKPQISGHAGEHKRAQAQDLDVRDHLVIRASHNLCGSLSPWPLSGLSAELPAMAVWWELGSHPRRAGQRQQSQLRHGAVALLGTDLQHCAKDWGRWGCSRFQHSACLLVLRKEKTLLCVILSGTFNSHSSHYFKSEPHGLKFSGLFARSCAPAIDKNFWPCSGARDI